MDSGKEGVIPLSDEMQEQLSWWYEDINLKMDLAKEIKRLRNIIEEMDDYLEIACASSGDDYQKAIKDVMIFFDTLKSIDK